MLRIKTFTFNPYQENTYLLINEENEGILIDPGCSEDFEYDLLDNYLINNDIKLTMLLNTHAHIDHVLGYYHVNLKYQLITRMHKDELPLFRAVKTYAPNYGFNYQEGPEPIKLLEDNEIIEFGNSSIQTILCPGHSPGSIAFYCKEQNFVIAGDVLFNRSIGRTDLPGGDHATLLRSIKNRMYSLPDETIVYCGHGPSTTIGNEKKYNPFVNAF